MLYWDQYEKSYLAKNIFKQNCSLTLTYTTWNWNLPKQKLVFVLKYNCESNHYNTISILRQEMLLWSNICCCVGYEQRYFILMSCKYTYITFTDSSIAWKAGSPSAFCLFERKKQKNGVFFKLFLLLREFELNCAISRVILQFKMVYDERLKVRSCVDQFLPMVFLVGFFETICKVIAFRLRKVLSSNFG